MDAVLNSMLVLVLALNLFALGTSRIRSLIRTVALQGVILGVIPWLTHAHAPPSAGLAMLAAIVLKGALIPAVMVRALRAADIKHEVEPMIGLTSSMLLGALGTATLLLLSGRMPMAPQHAETLLAPTALATILCGFILLVTRYKALTQVVGYLILENGIFIFGMLLLDAMPLVVELGALLDLFVGIFVICIIVNHINRAFASMDTRRLVSLRE